MSTGIKMGNVSNVSLVTVTFDVASVGAATSVQQTVTVPGVMTNDFVNVSNATHTAGLVYGPCRASATNTVLVTIANVTAGPLDPASQTLTFMVARAESQPIKTIVAD